MRKLIFFFGLVFLFSCTLGDDSNTQTRIYWVIEINRGDYLYGLKRAPLDDILQIEEIQAPQFGPEIIRENSNLIMDEENDLLYWNVFSRIFRSSSDGNNVTEIIDTGNDIHGLALDSAAGKIYWVHKFDDIISRADVDGQNAEIFLDDGAGLDEPESIIINQGSNVLYWLEDDTLKKASLITGTVDTIGVMPDHGGVPVLVIDESRRLAYYLYSTAFTCGIRSYNLDNGIDEIIVPEGELITRMALTHSGTTLYYNRKNSADFNIECIVKMDLTDDSKEIIIAEQHFEAGDLVSVINIVLDEVE